MRSNVSFAVAVIEAAILMSVVAIGRLLSRRDHPTELVVRLPAQRQGERVVDLRAAEVDVSARG